MTYIYIVIAVYLITGLYLTRVMLAGMQRRRSHLRDWVLGSVSMPVVMLIGLLCLVVEKLWARLLVALDYEPPEEMRAGPVEPAREDSSPHDRRSI